MTFDVMGTDLFGEPVIQSGGALAERFTIPPFSTLSARDGIWQERKRSWLSLGIKSEIGRKNELTYSGAAKSFDYYREKNGKNVKNETQSTSIFDPVLCELSYKWYCPKGGQIVDPFAGGSVRGIVASKLGYSYWGCDLSKEQISANIEQGKAVCDNNTPVWVNGDSMETLKAAPKSDFVFTCPPYGDLEVYSDHPADISNMEYHTFLAAYKRIIHRACNNMKDNSFACVVVANFRDKKTGFYRNFVSDTISAFLEQGLYLYNEAILLNAIGSLPMRTSKQFTVSRKLGKAHQNILTFIKGCPRKATEKIEVSCVQN